MERRMAHLVLRRAVCIECPIEKCEIGEELLELYDSPRPVLCYLTQCGGPT